MVRRRPVRNVSTVGSGRTLPWLGRFGKDVGKQFGRLVALVIWAAAVDPADVPMIRSASVTSIPASNRPAMTPITQALPADPPPPRTNARSLTTRHSTQPKRSPSTAWKQRPEYQALNSFRSSVWSDLPMIAYWTIKPKKRENRIGDVSRFAMCRNAAASVPFDNDCAERLTMRHLTTADEQTDSR